MSIMSVDLTPFGWINQRFFVQNPHARLAIVSCSVVQLQFLGGKQSNVWCEPVTPIFVRYFCPTHINSFGAYNHILSGKHIHLGLFENGVPQIPEDYIFSLFQFRIGKLRFYLYYLYPTQINYSLALAKCLFLSLRSHFREGKRANLDKNGVGCGVLNLGVSESSKNEGFKSYVLQGASIRLLRQLNAYEVSITTGEKSILKKC